MRIIQLLQFFNFRTFSVVRMTQSSIEVNGKILMDVKLMISVNTSIYEFDK